MKWDIDMKTLGIIGGVSPESTIEYYKFIVESFKSKKADGNFPQIIINSINLKTMIDYFNAGQLNEAAVFLTGEVKKLANAGAEFGLISANTPHLIFNEVQAMSPIPLISIIEASCRAVKNSGLKKVGLFGTGFTMRASFYPETFIKEGITIVVPDDEDKDYIHEKYMGELINGIFLDETRRNMLIIVEKLKIKHGIEGLILGGTELPLILRDSNPGIPLFDTTKIHVEEAVAQLLG